MNYNKILIGGNLTRDPEVRFLANGDAIVKFGLACNRSWKSGDGEKRQKATFVDVTMFGKRGEAFAQYHKKGQSAFLEGRLELDTWDDKTTGAKRSKLYVVAEGWEFVGSRDSASPESPDKGSETTTEETPF